MTMLKKGNKKGPPTFEQILRQGAHLPKMKKNWKKIFEGLPQDAPFVGLHRCMVDEITQAPSSIQRRHKKSLSAQDLQRRMAKLGFLRYLPPLGMGFHEVELLQQEEGWEHENKAGAVPW